MQPTSLYVTGTDTGVGKTLASAALLHALRARGLRAVGMKPVASGCAPGPAGLRNEDALRIQAQTSVPVDYESLNPYAFAPAIAPHIAAAESGVHIDIARIRRAYGELAALADCVVVEGVGGWKVPLNERDTVADLAQALALPVVLVVGVRLGCINHALLTADSILHHGCILAGWVANVVDAGCERIQENVATLDARLAAPLLGVIPPLDRLDADAIAARLALEPLAAPG